MRLHCTATSLQRQLPQVSLRLQMESQLGAPALHSQACCRSSFLTTSSACRLKATLERVQRMTHAYTELLLGVFPERVKALGGGLGIQQDRIQVGSPCSDASQEQNLLNDHGEGPRSAAQVKTQV